MIDWYVEINGGDYLYPIDQDEYPIEKRADVFQNRWMISTQVNQYRVSTVFLSLDHGYGGVPLVYETMIFGPDGDECYQERYTTRDEARIGHYLATKRAEAEDFRY